MNFSDYRLRVSYILHIRDFMLLSLHNMQLTGLYLQFITLTN